MHGRLPRRPDNPGHRPGHSHAPAAPLRTSRVPGRPGCDGTRGTPAAPAPATAAAADLSLTVDAGFGAEAVLPYLAVPLLTAALRRRPTEGAALLGVAAVALVVGGTLLADHSPITQPGFLAASGQWLVLGAIVPFAADTMRQFMQPAELAPQPYAEATRLLTQLRSVARSLPGATLDPGGISEHLLEELRLVAAADRAAVLSTSGGGRLVVLAQTGADRVDWETTLDSDSPIA